MDKNVLRKITALRHELHKNAELSLQEFRTKKILMDFLAENTKLRLVDRGKWFYAEYLSGNPEAEGILFRADFDALPIEETIDIPYASVTKGVSHKCGHDGHSAGLAGLAMEIDRLGSDKNIYFVFQHGEEIGAGGEECSSLIEEKGISRAYALHNRSGFPEGAVVIRDGMTQCASEGMELTFYGKTAHASQPETGVNPSGKIAEFLTYADSLTRTEKFGGMVLCTITHVQVGSYSFGIAAGEGKVCLVIRADLESDLKKMETLISQKAQEVCEAGGLRLECAIRDYFPETANHPAAAAEVRKAAALLGKNVIEMEKPWRASEDFGYYTRKCPGAMFYVGNGETYPHVHTKDYDYNDNILETGVDLFYQLTQL